MRITLRLSIGPILTSGQPEPPLPPEDPTGTYLIIVRGHLSAALADWFSGCQVTTLPDGNTLIIGRHLDQPAFFGLLLCIRDFGLPLLFAARQDSPFEDLQPYFHCP